MQNRRTTDDDAKGVLEALNETDKNEFGIQVNAPYFVQIFDFKRAKSLQRSQQILMDQPMEVLYSLEEIDMKNLSKASNQKQHKSLIQLQTIKNASQKDDFTYRVHPVERNKIFVRVENLADRFDSSKENGEPVKYVNLIKFAQEFWQQANPGVKQNITVDIEERAITDFASQTDLQKDLDHRDKWIGIGDDLINKTTLIQQPKDISNTALAFEPQRIRSFVISYKKAVTPEEIKTNESKVKEDENKVVNLGKNGRTNIDRINKKISNEKVKKLDQTPQSSSFLSTQHDEQQFQSLPSSEFELLRI